METNSMTAANAERPRARQFERKDPETHACVMFQVRLPIALAKRVNASAEAANISRNAWVKRVLAEAATAEVATEV